MQRSPARDLTVGAFVLCGLAALGYLSLTLGGLSYRGPGGFTLYASFDEIGGLKARAPVRVAGVKVGQVESITLDEYLRARVELDLDPSLELPVDTRASVQTDGVLGDKYVALEPGAELEALASGEEIDFTESALVLERLIGKFVADADLGDDS